MKLKALDQRQAGILLPLFSLPGKHGIGDLGKEAYEFVDLSAQAGFSIWQILPLNPSSSGNSPYTPYSSFAGDEIYISLELLKDWHLLDEVPNYLQDLKRVDYKRVRLFKDRYLRKAYQVFLKDKELEKEYRTFVKGTFWLKKYARFMALNKANEGLPWVDWNDEDQNIKGSNEGLEAEIDYIQFLQYIVLTYQQELSIHISSNVHFAALPFQLQFLSIRFLLLLVSIVSESLFWHWYHDCRNMILIQIADYVFHHKISLLFYALLIRLTTLSLEKRLLTQ